MKNLLIYTFLFLIAFFHTACVYDPESGENIYLEEKKTFTGLSVNPGATIELYVFNKNRNWWGKRAQTVSSTNPQTWFNNRTHYIWNLEFALETIPNWRCFLDADCIVIDGKDYTVRFQFREVGSDVAYLYTYGPGGLSCWYDKYYNAGQDMYDAYGACAPDNYEEIILNYRGSLGDI
ncbi:hypothetical protein [Microbulbifer sp. TYP-18]|uniref:hypothetical protein n=1 Tax=Microbulbifer sp. TYP-18 TaxID=3230024 RepID=UPI0034C6DA5C